MGPGGGPGGIEGGDGCTGSGYFKYVGIGGGYAANAYGYQATWQCGAGRTVFGKSYGSALLQPLIGGSGGGGGRGGTTYPGSGGGGGGGAMLLAVSGKLTLSGSIAAQGGDGGGLSGAGAGGQGAGGSGGSIRLMATSIVGAGSVRADGGCINSGGNRRQLCDSTGGSGSGYGGAPGRIRFEAESITFTGTQSPAYTTDLPGPVFIADAPALRIGSVAGQAVSANPTGNADILLPAGSTASVITFETTNVPTGNTVLLRVVPAYGQPIEVLSPAIAGTTAAGTASVTVTLPAGPSTLQATTTYTVVVAGDIDLSRFAQNEAVEKVEVTVPMVGAAQARLITRTGKSFGVPYEALRAAGFRG